MARPSAGAAAASGRSYADLLRDRYLEPLGMTGTYLPERPTDLRPGAVAGTNRRGRPVAPSTGAGIGPAGGVRMPVGDLAILLSALLQGSAPGSARWTRSAGSRGGRCASGPAGSRGPGAAGK